MVDVPHSPARRGRPRRPTSTSNFGVGSRQGHDASGFYDRFAAPVVTKDCTIPSPMPVVEPFVHGDARNMDQLADGSVALVVTSPPYFAGKQYEEELERDGVPGTYLEYLEMLTDVFAECRRALEPGGRIAVNVANLGRKPYRSLSGDVIRILEHDLGFLLRGEIVWQKAEGASGSCAWGTYCDAANPVLRDVTERIVVASKGRFDRALTPAERADAGLPHRSTMRADDFMALTLDVWNVPPESARRVGHPAPFPVELPERLIQLYTFSDDLVVDPFMGSGSTLVAASRLGRRYVGYDLDADYVEIARHRVAEEGNSAEAGEPDESVLRRSTARRLARQVVEAAGFSDIVEDRRVPKSGVAVALAAVDGNGAPWHFDVTGSFTSRRGGLLRTDTLWKSLGRASAVKGRSPQVPLVWLTTDLPKPGSEGDVALRAAGPGVVFDAVGAFCDDGLARLRRYAAGGHTAGPLPGFWSPAQLADTVT